jgi:hypothetical protein
VTPAIDQVISLPLATPLPFALKEKGEKKKGKAIPVNVTGRARIFLQGTIPIRPLRHCTMNLPPLQSKSGGMIKN